MTEKQLKMREMGMEVSYLAACALQGKVPENAPSDPEALYKFCKFHSITSIVAMALEEIWKTAPIDEAVMKKWRQNRDQVIRKNILLNAERERILGYLESIGCWYMPLKGSLLQYDYPKFGMRQMSDNDILFDESMHRQVYEFMTGSGYEAVTYQQGKDDEYVKKPLYNIEMHRALFGNALYPELAEYFRDVKQRLIKDEQNRFGYHFSREDFYIYMVTHAYKHFIHGGIGIRNLLDVYVYDSKYGAEMDWEYLGRELGKLGAWEFDLSCRRLGKKLFADPDAHREFSPEELAVLDNFFSSGTFGTEQQAMEKRLKALSGDGKSGGKLRYVLQRLFPRLELLKERYHILYQHPWLAPVYYVIRLFSLIFRREAIGRELRNLGNAEK